MTDWKTDGWKYTDEQSGIHETRHEADQVMSKSNITDWGATQAKKQNVMGQLEG